VSLALLETSVARLAGLYMAPLAERAKRSLMILSANNGFFDESGTHDGSQIITLGGLIASYEAWSRWELEWNKILASRGIKVFHFSEFMAREGEFKNNWTNDERNLFMERLCKTISDNILVGLACSVFRDEYEACLPTSLQQTIRHPYYFGVYTVLFMLLNWKVFHVRLTLPTPIRLLFDRKKGYEGFASAIYYAVLQKFEEWGKDVSILGDMGFGSKAVDIPLQAADLFVGVAGRHFLRCRRKDLEPQENLEKSFLALGESGRLLVANNGPDELKAFAAALGW